MEHENETTNELTEEVPTGVAVEIESDATLGYASIQNAVPVIRSLRLTNHGTEALQDVEVLIACNPSFAQGIKLRFDKLAVGESRLIWGCPRFCVNGKSFNAAAYVHRT
jgi:hypothetical protein